LSGCYDYIGDIYRMGSMFKEIKNVSGDPDPDMPTFTGKSKK
jgi:hypothetical protein